MSNSTKLIKEKNGFLTGFIKIKEGLLSSIAKMEKAKEVNNKNIAKFEGKVEKEKEEIGALEEHMKSSGTTVTKINEFLGTEE